MTNETNVEAIWFSHLLLSFLFSYQKKASRLTSSKPIRKKAKRAVAWDEQWNKALLEFCSSNSVFVSIMLVCLTIFAKSYIHDMLDYSQPIMSFLIFDYLFENICNVYWSHSLPCLNSTQVHLPLWEIFIGVYQFLKIRTDPWDILYWATHQQEEAEVQKLVN